MKLLLLPENNSLSHIIKCLSIKDILETKGHQVVITSSEARSSFLKNLSVEHYVLPDIQQSDNAPLPTINWFRQPQRIVACIQAEVDLIRKEKPDRVIGVFRFTAKASAQIAGIPYDSLICGCMTPDFNQVLGYRENEIGYQRQGEFLNNFYCYVAGKMNRVFRAMRVSPIDDMRDLFKGERTFLWDFPEFLPLPSKSDTKYLGPFFWKKWPYDLPDIYKIINDNIPFAIVSFGTGDVSSKIIQKIIKILLKMGYSVLLAAGGHAELLKTIPDKPRLYKYLFAPIHHILPYASLIITHGGQMTIFESLLHKVPVVVMPLQPEQLHNGLCLERTGCGCRLVIPEPFRGNKNVYSKALYDTSDTDIEAKIKKLTNNPQTSICLKKMSEKIKKYNCTENLTKMAEE